MNNPNDRNCLRCGKSLAADDRFCAACGWDQRSAPFKLSFKAGALLTASAALLALAGGQVTAFIAGNRPTVIYTPAADNAGSADQLSALRKAAAENRDSSAEWKNLALALVGAMQGADETGRSALLHELIDALQEVLRISPRDPDALLAMADITFEQQLLEPALKYYQRYLEIEPENDTIRARYASALSLLGRYQEAITELNQVLQRDPQKFTALSYLAITYLQAGESEKAAEARKRALEAAPNNEIREQLEEFFRSRAADAAAATSGKPEAGSGFESWLRNHPIAGPKLVSVTIKDRVAAVTMRDFPMQSMPEEMREAFLGKARKAAADAGISGLMFVDANSGAIMSEVKASQ